MQYLEIKQAAAEMGCKAEDLFVLAPQNDPFYMGQPSQVKKGQWFLELWRRFGYHSGVHLRRIHYQIVSQDPPPALPNGEAYENTNYCWKILSEASKCARYLGYIDISCFDDRRNNQPYICDVDPEFDGDTRLEIEEDLALEYDSFDLADRFPRLPSFPIFQVQGFEIEQRYHLEIWAEKTTMNDILIPLCEKYGVNLITGLGELSITAVSWLIDRTMARQRSCRILYVSDFDPAGISMPVAVSRKIEKQVLDKEVDGDFLPNIRVFPTVLSETQCRKYNLPRTPIKETERRAGKFEARFGAGATELDALEALHPGELEKIIVERIERYRDLDLSSKLIDARDDVEARNDDIRNQIIADHDGKIQNIRQRYQDLKDRFTEIAVKLSPEMTALFEDIKRVWGDIRVDMESHSIDESDLPEPDYAEEISCLFDSGRSYFDQLAVYKKFQGK